MCIEAFAAVISASDRFHRLCRSFGFENLVSVSDLSVPSLFPQNGHSGLFDRRTIRYSVKKIQVRHEDKLSFREEKQTPRAVPAFLQRLLVPVLEEGGVAGSPCVRGARDTHGGREWPFRCAAPPPPASGSVVSTQTRGCWWSVSYNVSHTPPWISCTSGWLHPAWSGERGRLNRKNTEMLRVFFLSLVWKDNFGQEADYIVRSKLIAMMSESTLCVLTLSQYSRVWYRALCWGAPFWWSRVTQFTAFTAEAAWLRECIESFRCLKI